MEGVSILEPVLTPHGFVFEFREEGRGAGGLFARGEFVSGDRRLELHFRYSLGLVTYHVGANQVSHAAYMDELGVRSQASYAGFSDAPMDGFRHLASDLERFASDFLLGDGSIAIRAAKADDSRSELENRASMAGYVGDARKREEARRRFQAQDWKGVVVLLESLQFPDQMDRSDERRLELARRRAATS
jgi:hypothetical protein